VERFLKKQWGGAEISDFFIFVGWSASALFLYGTASWSVLENPQFSGGREGQILKF
jgi:hypothetical protein